MMNSAKVTNSFNLMTLNAEEILKCAEITTDPNGNHGIRFSVDLRSTSYFSNSMCLDGINAHDSNALFYQLQKVLGADSSSDEDLLLHSLVFLDFKSVFQTAAEYPLGDPSSKSSLSKKELETLIHSPRELCRFIFDPSIGFYLKLDGVSSEIHFVPYDKSASMSRQSRISFIDETLKEKLEPSRRDGEPSPGQRLLLDFDFRSIPIPPSKFYAYRGLYLSSGRRVEQDDSFPFNENTVIVINDDEKDILKVKKDPLYIFGGKLAKHPSKMPDNSSAENPEDDSAPFFWSLGAYHTSEEDKVEVNFFDGEGLISPRYASMINQKLGINDQDGSRQASSFQIRMPFTKGVLHTVDFHAFLRESFGDGEDLIINDCFGISRRIMDAQIILTVSMFKCCKWIRTLMENGAAPKDPMVQYFEKFKAYDHALYVASTDLSLRNTGCVDMNYQFLNTLAMDETDFRSLAEYHLKHTEDETVKQDLFRSFSHNAPAWIQALQQNEAFLSDPLIRQNLADAKWSLVRDLGLGHLLVKGESRIFSCDLLSLLVFISKEILRSSPHLDQAALPHLPGDLARQCLYEDKFFMPKTAFPLYSSRQYAFFRSPHLSRNEQCLLRPYLPSDKETDLYQKYFSHLAGVVMVSRDSLSPKILSGADFDGDLVKIVADDIIVRSVRRGAYEDAGTNDASSRSLPIVMIPDTKSMGRSSIDHGSVPYAAIENTFSNRIGQISNLAIRAGKRQYFYHIKDDLDLCAACTLVTGLEIDAAKTGVHPDANISEIQSSIKAVSANEGDSYLKFKDVIEGLSSGIFVETSSSDPSRINIKEYANAWKDPKKAKNVLTIKMPGESGVPVANIELLPSFFADAAQGDHLKAPKVPGDQHVRFVFQEAAAWKKSLDLTKYDKVKELMDAYKDVLSAASELAQLHSSKAKTSYAACAYNILQIQYDSMTAPLPLDFLQKQCDAIDVPLPEETDSVPLTPQAALDHAFLAMKQKFLAHAEDENETPLESVERAIRMLKEEKWHLSSPKDRPLLLKRIAGIGCGMPSSSLAVLTNFSSSGFKLLYYLLAMLKSELLSGMSPQDYEDMQDQDGSAQTAAFSLLYRCYSVQADRKVSKRIWQKMVCDLCRDELIKLYCGDLDEALKYVFAYCMEKKRLSSQQFLWNVIPSDVILRNVYKPKHSAEEKGGKTC